MKKHVLLVMKWLNDNDSVTKQELLDNSDEAYEAINTAYNAAHAAHSASYGASADVEHRLNRYFETSGASRQDYIDELEGYNE